MISFFNSLGLKSKLALYGVSSLTWLAMETLRETGDRFAHNRPPFRLSLFFIQADRVGVGSVPLVAMVSVFLGLTMALLTGYQLERFGTERLVPGLVAISFTRELGPLLTGIVVAARIGAAYTAELGTMTVSEEVEAIEGMGIGPLRFLVAPRVLAIFILLPCLSIISILSALAGAAFISRFMLDISWASFYDLVMTRLIIRDIVTGIIKSYLFGFLVGIIACYKGLTVKKGASGVGQATTSSVVTAITTVIGFDTLCNIISVALFE